MEQLYLSKGLRTTQITRDEAAEWLDYLKAFSDSFLRDKYRWYFLKGYFPIKAQRKNQADPEPKFIVNHHTGGTKTSPVIARFTTAKMASSNFIVERDGNIIYLVSVHNLSFHATMRTWLPLSVRRALGIESKWLNEPGIETVGNGMKYLFRPEQLKSVIVLQRYLKAYFPSIEQLKSHKFFSPKSRAGDPGYLYLLPLVEHAVFNDVDLTSPNYWFYQYEKDPINFVNNAKNWIETMKLGQRDEWGQFRSKEVNIKNVLTQEREIFVKKST